MELKTKIHSEEGKQELLITREFDLPVDLLFKAFVEPDLLAQWMGTKVVKFDCQSLGSYAFETTDPQGNIHGFSGTFHTVTPDKKIVRTFEIAKAPFGPQLEFMDFEKLTESTSKLTIQIVFRSTDLRNQILQLPFAQGINMAHNRIQELLTN